MLRISDEDIPQALKDPKLILTQDSMQIKLDTEGNEQYLMAIASNKELLRVVKAVETRLVELNGSQVVNLVGQSSDAAMQIHHYNNFL